VELVAGGGGLAVVAAARFGLRWRWGERGGLRVGLWLWVWLRLLRERVIAWEPPPGRVSRRWVLAPPVEGGLMRFVRRVLVLVEAVMSGAVARWKGLGRSSSVVLLTRACLVGSVKGLGEYSAWRVWR
jgi:hypothetical protein